MPGLTPINFSVASELLRELGERLVGRQYIALAELIKNSFDADATKVEIRICDDSIEVSDNGHGMTYQDFSDRWMHVGSTHKLAEAHSPGLGRRLTGSKGVGRLAVQFLARELVLTSVPKRTRVAVGDSPQQLHVEVDWEQAIRSRDLTEAKAFYSLTRPASTDFKLGGRHGTKVTLKGLKHGWTTDELQKLASEVWFLQPPFRSMSGTDRAENSGFQVDLFSEDPEAETSFGTQMNRMQDLYRSRLVGKLSPVAGGGTSGKRTVQLSLELERGPVSRYEYPVPVSAGERCLIDSLEFEIRIFNLRGRQAYGIPVQQARNYMNEWGGVHIYDAGFRIPSAGADADWLRLEFDHAHRLTTSKLLPEALNVPLGLNHLPTNSRVLGVVNIDAAREARLAELDGRESNHCLQIQVTRDRLVANEAFAQLRDTVRFALDYYATRMAALRAQVAQDDRAAKRGVETPMSLVENVWDVLEKNKEEIPSPVADEIRTELVKTIESVRQQSEWTRSQSGLLGAMATVGATAMAFDHQFNQQLNILEHHAASLEEAVATEPRLWEAVGGVAEHIKRWIRDARDTRAIFSPISNESDRTAVGRFRANTVVESMAGNVRAMLRGVDLEVSGIDPHLLLPEASYPVWMAIFHNLFMNSSNAMLDSETKRISVSSFDSSSRRGIHIQDTGVGIDLKKADELFQPLKRGLEISQERRALGYGGTGLGLAIVRMLANDVKADVRFVAPEAPFRTCFEMAWREGS